MNYKGIQVNGRAYVEVLLNVCLQGVRKELKDHTACGREWNPKITSMKQECRTTWCL
jgi:hypothetical protein